MEYSISQVNKKGESKDTSLRKELDFYPTPPAVTKELLKHINIIHGDSILECACGDGAISKELRKYSDENNLNLNITSSDIKDYGYPNTRIMDFLNYSVNDLFAFSWVITNPPFNLANKFIEKCYNCLPRFALLLPVRYVTGKQRMKWLKSTAFSKEIVIPYKMDSTGEGKPFMEVAWYVWDVTQDNRKKEIIIGDWK